MKQSIPWLAVRALLSAILSVASILVACDGGGGGSVTDTTPPTVTATDPSDNALGVQTNDPIKVTFSEPIAAASVNSNSFVIENSAGQPVTGGTRTINNRTAIFTPGANTFAKSERYQVTLTGIQDRAGNALAIPFTFSFTISTDAWTSTNTTGAPTGRLLHTAVWTGNEMIVWGGSDGTLLRTGGRYDPVNDVWVATDATQAAPVERANHTAVWTGKEMIVWGGDTNNSEPATNTGGIYTPSPGPGTWATISPQLLNTPTPRSRHTAIWTGKEMIIWGGLATGPMRLNTGGRFNPTAGGTWQSTNDNGASGVPTPRTDHTAVWTGTEMIVWGGTDDLGVTNAGARYNPTTDTWKRMADAPIKLTGHTAVWTGTEMIVWGGVDDSGQMTSAGARYNPATDRWTLTTIAGAPLPSTRHTAVWTGSEMIVWGGNNSSNSNQGHAYRPASDTWRAIDDAAPNTPTARTDHTAVWTGAEMIVWGGNDTSGATNSGGRFVP